MLQHEEFTNAIYLASNDKEFRIEFSEKRIDVVLMDIRLRNASGLDLIKEVINRPNSPKIIAVTGLDGVELIVNLLKLGVHGIVNKLNGYSEIIRSIQAVMKDESYFPENVFRIIQSNAHRWDEVPSVLLTFQERELLKAVSSGATTKEIAPQFENDLCHRRNLSRETYEKTWSCQYSSYDGVCLQEWYSLNLLDF